MKVRFVEPRDRQAWAAMRAELWPNQDPDLLAHQTLLHFSGAKLAEAIFVAEDVDGRTCGFLELSVRANAEGCSASPVPFIEAWFVTPGARHKGAGRLLAQAAEHWAIIRNFSEIASKADVEDALSQGAHAALGYEEVERVVTYRKSLRV